MDKKFKNFFMLVLSDIHFGHDKNSTLNIVTNLRRFFKTYRSKIIKSKLIIISGDIFEKLLNSNSEDMLLATEWLTELVMFCKEHNIKLRILEGTPSHDWKQVRVLYNIIKNLNIDIDFKYFDTLDIEYIEDLDVNILYHPDNWKGNNEQIAKTINNKLKEYNLKQVDIAVLHGAFKFQLPDFIDNLLDPDYFLSIVKGPIICGHVHIHSIYMRINIPGSFDALRHGEGESDKGGLFINYKGDTFTTEFLINKYKLIFETYDVRDKTINDISKLLDKIHNVKITKHIKLIVLKDTKLSSNILELNKKYPMLHITIDDLSTRKSHKTIDVTYTTSKAKTLDNQVLLDYIIDNIKTIPKHKQISILKEYNEI